MRDGARSGPCTRPARAVRRRAASATMRSIARIELGGGTDFVQQAQPLRLVGAEALRGQEIAPRRTRADRLDHVGADRRRDQAQPRFRQRERRVAACRSRCRSRRRGRRRRRRPRRARARWSAWPMPLSVASMRRQRVGVGEILRVGVARHALHPVQVGARAEAARRVPASTTTRTASSAAEHRDGARELARSASRRTRCARRAASSAMPRDRAAAHRLRWS